jgi:lipopolysaccharide biosynthesis regulator YciM
MKIKHNKFKNTGILFELLTRQITADIMSNKESAAVGIVKKYFSRGEVAKEYKLYQTLTKVASLSEAKAETVISSTVKLAERINRTALRKEKYNLIKEIKEKYDLEEFFKAKIHNYKAHAAIYNLIEAHVTLEFIDPSFVVDNKVTLLEFLTKQNVDKDKIENQVMAEYASQDKSTRALISKLMIEKFNTKYSALIPEQRDVLKTYINNVSNTVSLREYVNKSFESIKKSLEELKSKVSDQRTQIKLNELVSIIKPLDKTESVKDEDILNLLQFHELLHEIKTL